jgi:hypothetical protein
MPSGRPRKIVENTDSATSGSVSGDTLKQLLDKITYLEGQLNKRNSVPESKEDKAPSMVIVAEEEKLDEFDSIKINQDDYIKVVSLCNHELNLSTTRFNKGGKPPFMFKKFGETKRILYSDLVQIMENHANFLNDGLFFIADKRVIRRHGLNELYEKILSKEKIEGIINGNIKDFVSILRETTKEQQKIVCDIVMDKLLAGEKMDLNLIKEISEVTGINISENTEYNKRYLEVMNINK